jgi:hypothetical protein
MSRKLLTSSIINNEVLEEKFLISVKARRRVRCNMIPSSVTRATRLRHICRRGAGSRFRRGGRRRSSIWVAVISRIGFMSSE